MTNGVITVLEIQPPEAQTSFLPRPQTCWIPPGAPIDTVDQEVPSKWRRFSQPLAIHTSSGALPQRELPYSCPPEPLLGPWSGHFVHAAPSQWATSSPVTQASSGPL